MLSVTRMRCEYLDEPLGIDVLQPRLGWWVTSERRGATQTAYQIQVASDPSHLATTPDLWDSGKVDGADVCQILYGGRELTSRLRCHWRVRVWDEAGQASPWSDSRSWEMGLLEPSDWRAQWIGDPSRTRRNPGRVSYFRRDVILDEAPSSARVYVSAHGLYELRINGTPVSTDLFRPGWTDYRKRTPYQVYDVSRLLTAGENVVAAVLADGWYSGHVAWVPTALYGPRPWLLVQLEAGDGAEREVLTPAAEGWTVGTGPIRSSDMLMGEQYDARELCQGWDLPGSLPAHWRPALTRRRRPSGLRAHPGPPVRRTGELQAVSLTPGPKGDTVVDLGQNFSGWARVRLSGPRGARVRIRYGEMLDADGSVYVENLRGASASDEYVLSGDGEETWEPTFTYHGFRYVSIHAPSVEVHEVVGVAVHSDMPRTGTFHCSSELLNQLQSNIEWGQRSNFFEVPTDCPQRDERLGWLGDAQIFANTACFNMDVSAFFTKWLNDVFGAQRQDGAFSDIAPEIFREFNGKEWPGGAPGWGDAGVLVPLTMHVQYGDDRVIRDNLSRFEAWVEYVRANNPDLVWRAEMNNNYGDWLSVGEKTPKEVVATSYFFHTTSTVARLAARVGNTSSATYHSRLAEGIRVAFRDAFVDGEGRIAGDTQTAYVLALRFGLAQGSQREQASAHLARRIEECGGKLSTGFLGVGHVLPALAGAGQLATAFRLLLSTDFPSWGYSIRHGATTMWERWDGWTEHNGFQDPHMNSFNHYAFGAVGEWMYDVLGGIAAIPESPGYSRVRVQPRPGYGVDSASAQLDSIRGPIATKWWVDEGTFELALEVPPTVTAEVHLPATRDLLEGEHAIANAVGVKVLGDDGTTTVVEVGSGRYVFRAPFPTP